MKGILLPRNYFKFPLVKFIVSKIAYESLENTKNERFLKTDHRNVVFEIFLSDIGDVMLVRNFFRPIRVINCTNSRPIWTPTCEDIDHIAKSTSNPPLKKSRCFYGKNMINFIQIAPEPLIDELSNALQILFIRHLKKLSRLLIKGVLFFSLIMANNARDCSPPAKNLTLLLTVPNK